MYFATGPYFYTSNPTEKCGSWRNLCLTVGFISTVFEGGDEVIVPSACSSAAGKIRLLVGGRYLLLNGSVGQIRAALGADIFLFPQSFTHASGLLVYTKRKHLFFTVFKIGCNTETDIVREICFQVFNAVYNDPFAIHAQHITDRLRVNNSAHIRKEQFNKIVIKCHTIRSTVSSLNHGDLAVFTEYAAICETQECAPVTDDLDVTVKGTSPKQDLTAMVHGARGIKIDGYVILKGEFSVNLIITGSNSKFIWHFGYLFFPALIGSAARLLFLLLDARIVIAACWCFIIGPTAASGK